EGAKRAGRRPAIAISRVVGGEDADARPARTDIAACLAQAAQRRLIEVENAIATARSAPHGVDGIGRIDGNYGTGVLELPDGSVGQTKIGVGYTDNDRAVIGDASGFRNATIVALER